MEQLQAEYCRQLLRRLNAGVGLTNVFSRDLQNAEAPLSSWNQTSRPGTANAFRTRSQHNTTLTSGAACTSSTASDCMRLQTLFHCLLLVLLVVFARHAESWPPNQRERLLLVHIASGMPALQLCATTAYELVGAKQGKTDIGAMTCSGRDDSVLLHRTLRGVSS